MSDGKLVGRLNDNVGGHILSLVERVERIEEEVSDLNADKADIYREAKEMGFNTKILKKVIARRRRSSDELDEEEMELGLYEDAIDRALRNKNTSSSSTQAPDPLDL